MQFFLFPEVAKITHTSCCRPNNRSYITYVRRHCQQLSPTYNAPKLLKAGFTCTETFRRFFILFVPQNSLLFDIPGGFPVFGKDCLFLHKFFRSTFSHFKKGTKLAPFDNLQLSKIDSSVFKMNSVLKV